MNADGQAASVGWAECLRSSDAGQVWRRLHRLVRNHPLTRTSSTTAVSTWTTPDTHDDLTQELFVTLLSKDRFRHYLEAGMSDSEIETEIAQIELTNLLTAGLRKRYPESYRLARRISVLLRTCRTFRRFDAAGRGGGRHTRLAEQVYGLSRWPDATASLPTAELERRAAAVPVRRRDLRMKGCTGDSQLIIGNAELEGLIVEVLEAMGAPADVRTIRSLVLSRLPILDAHMTQFRAAGEEEDGKVFEPVDVRPTPEQEALRRDCDRRAGQRVDEFLSRLGAEVSGKAKQYERILSVLRLCYLSAERPTQLEVAACLGVSDSLVSDYRRRIERALRSLSLTSIEEARGFEEALQFRVKAAEVSCAAPEEDRAPCVRPAATPPLRSCSDTATI
jgi:predicted transcriptional regulator